MTTSNTALARRQRQRSSALGLYASFDLASAVRYCLALLVSRDPSGERGTSMRAAPPLSVDA